MNIPPEARARGAAAGKASQRRAYFARVQRRLSAELAPLADRIPLDELLPIAVRIYSRAYDIGYHADYNRRRKASAR